MRLQKGVPSQAAKSQRRHRSIPLLVTAAAPEQRGSLSCSVPVKKSSTAELGLTGERAPYTDGAVELPYCAILNESSENMLSCLETWT